MERELYKNKNMDKKSKKKQGVDMVERKIIVLAVCMLMMTTLFFVPGITDTAIGVVATPQIPICPSDKQSVTDPDPFSSSKEVYTIDPRLSSVELTSENTAGLTTCPVGDGPEYRYLKITIRNQNGQGIPGIPADAFLFMLTPVGDTHFFGTLSCTFTGYGPVISTAAKISTNNKGEILFKIVGDTTIIGSIIIQVVVGYTNEQLLIDSVQLPCKSFDLNNDGVVNCIDYKFFLNVDHNIDSLQGDFDWDGNVDEDDLKMFLLHLEEPCPINEPPIIPYDPEPENHSVNVSIHTSFSWSSGDPNRDDMVTYAMSIADSNANIFTFIIGTYPATEHRITWIPTSPLLEYGKLYLWRITATDDQGISVAGPFWSLRTGNYSDTEPPSQVPGFHVNAEKDTELDLIWNPATDNVAVDHYVLSRVSDHGFTITTHELYYNDLGLTNGQLYTYEIYAVDTSGLPGPISITSGTPKTTTTHHSTGSSNQPPVADLSAGEPYQGFVGEELLFDASRSYDRDGTIVHYSWVFGDRTEEAGITVPHEYNAEGSYIVTLTVTDNGGETDDATTTVIIREPNIPPVTPLLSGPIRGRQNIDYVYSFSASDPDGEFVRYFFTWGDGTSSISPSFKDERTIQTFHRWNEPGFYTITLQAEDMDKARSDSVSIVVWIDVWYVKDIGYLINTDGTGFFDHFYSNSTGVTSITTVQNSLNYLIDIDDDGTWDFQYNIASDELLPYERQQLQDYAFLILLMTLGGLFIILFYIALTRKKILNQQEKENRKGAKNPRSSR